MKKTVIDRLEEIGMPEDVATSVALGAPTHIWIKLHDHKAATVHICVFGDLGGRYKTFYRRWLYKIAKDLGWKFV